MNLLDTVGELGGLLLGLALTLFVFSYVYKDNPLYRAAVHLLVGVSAGFAVIVLVNEVIFPFSRRIISDPIRVGNIIYLIPIALSVLLLFKAIPNLSWVGNSSMAALIGTGAAVGLLGAVVGTLIPQTFSRTSGGIIGIIGALLTITTLAYFYFSSHLNESRDIMISRWLDPVRLIGRAVITMALAGVFAGVLATSLVLLTERIGFFISAFQDLFESLLT
jgi:hypothetical protein